MPRETSASSDVFDRIASGFRNVKPDEDFDLRATMWRMHRISEITHLENTEIAREFDITLGEMMTLCSLLLSSADARQRLTDLARMLRVTPAAMTPRVDRLVAMALVTRSNAADDRRAVELSLTEKGHAFANELVSRAAASFVRACREMPPEDQSALQRLVRNVHIAVEKRAVK